MSLKFLGKKKGMMRFFDEKGDAIVCSVISLEPSVVTQIKKKDKDGYNAIQLGAVAISSSRIKKLNKPLGGHFQKAGVAPRKYLSESRVDDVDQYTVGQELNVTYFTDVGYVDVAGTSKGKGYQGVIKRHGFSGGPASHGSGFHRHAGSTGMRTSPGRCLPGVKKAGRMGGEQVTIQSLRIVKIDEKRGILLVEGAIPGPTGSVISVNKAKKIKK